MKISVVLAASCAALVVGVAPPIARAHHVVSDHGIAPVMPQTVASVDVSAASFDFGASRGHWQAVTPNLELAWNQRLSFFAALPLARVWQDGHGADAGVGDLSLSAKVALYATDHGEMLISAGLGAELPTGRPGLGLGSGHVELTPFLTAATVLYDGLSFQLLLHGLVSPRFALGGGAHADGGAHAHSHGSVLAPHGDREAFGRSMVAAAMRRIYVAAGAEGAVVFSDDAAGYLAPRLEVGLMLMRGVRAFVSGDAVALGERRFGVRGGAGVAWLGW